MLKDQNIPLATQNERAMVLKVSLLYEIEPKLFSLSEIELYNLILVYWNEFQLSINKDDNDLNGTYMSFIFTHEQYY